MQEAETSLKQAAIEFLEAAGTVATRAAEEAGSTDPLDEVDTDLFDLGDLEPAIGEDDLASLKRRLARERLSTEAVLELVALARQVAGTLMDG